MNKFIPNLCAPLRPLPERDGKWIWKKKQEQVLETIEVAIRKHFKQKMSLRNICEASKKGSGSVLHQKWSKAGKQHILARISTGIRS